jgi:spermidine synthase
MTTHRTPLLPLFLVSAAAVGFEIALTRFFAIASWSEYGYWVISITMVGFAVSGVVLSLFKDFFVRRGPRLLFATPLLLIIAAAAGYYATTLVPFNPLEFQNPDQWGAQLANIGKYYAALFPFYFLTGLYIGLYFLSYQDDIPKIYGADLAGAGAGSLAVLVAMFVVPPFQLLAALLPLLAFAGFYHMPAAWKPRRAQYLGVLALVLAAAETVVIGFNRADFNEYKAIYPPLHVQGNQVVEQVRSPRGYFLVLDNFTERLDTDLSNNFKVLGVGGPPSTYGVYGDGNRLTSLPKTDRYDTSYVRAALDAFPYELKTAPRVLLIGTRGGFRLREALDLGATRVEALEPDETLYGLIRAQDRNPALADPHVRLDRNSPAGLAREEGGRYDIVDIASDFLGQGDANKHAFTVEALQGYLHVARDDGIVSLPVSIREFTVYAVKMIETARRALIAAGVSEPGKHILVYRSSWNARVLLSRTPFGTAQIARLRAFADRRSFDVSYFAGMDPATVPVWNDLPNVSFTAQTMLRTEQASDALREDALQLFAAPRQFLDGQFFNLEPSTHDRPFFYSILRLAETRAVLDRIALVPREEVGYLINLAVLAQAVVLAVLVLALPLIRWRHAHPRTEALVKSVLYFAALGLGFLFLEILLIEKAAFLFADRTYAFAIVLTGMLMFSGLGSFLAGRYLADPRRGILIAAAGVVLWCVVALPALDWLLWLALGWPFALKALLLVAITAPLAVALGFPFPLGLALFRGPNSHFLPWAWSLNGAFSVIATPLANLLTVSEGYTLLLILSLFLYLIVYLTFPVARGRDRVS